MALATLSIDLEARLANLQQGLDKAGRLAEKESARMAKAFSVASTALAGIGAAVSVGGLVTFFDKVLTGLDALNDLADATGASIENLSALESVALKTGVSLETAGSVLVKFNSVLKDAKPGNDAGAALKALGLNAEELKRIDPAEALRQTAVALAGFADDGNKARIIQELFGKSVKDAAPFLKDLAEQGRLVARVTKEQAEEAEKFNKQLFALQTFAVDASRSIAGPLISSINALISKMKEAQREGRLAAVESEEFIKRLIQLAPKTPFLQGLGLGVQVLARRSTPAESGVQPPGFRPSQNYGDAYRPSLPGSLGGGGKLPRSSGEPDIGYGITDPFEDTKQRFLQAEKDYEATDEILRRIEQRASEASEAMRKSLGEQGRAVFEATRTPAEALAAEIERLNKLLQAGAIDWDTYARANMAAQKTFDASLKKNAETFDEFTKNAIAGFQSVLGDGLADIFNGTADNIERRFVQMMNRLIAEALAAELTKKLFGSAGGGGEDGVASALITSLFSSLPGFDVGTPYVPRDMVAKVHKGERIVTAAENRAGRGAGMGMTVVQQFTVGGQPDRRTLQQVGAAAARGLATASARNN